MTCSLCGEGNKEMYPNSRMCVECVEGIANEQARTEHNVHVPRDIEVPVKAARQGN